MSFESLSALEEENGHLAGINWNQAFAHTFERSYSELALVPSRKVPYVEETPDSIDWRIGGQDRATQSGRSPPSSKEGRKERIRRFSLFMFGKKLLAWDLCLSYVSLF